MNAYNNSCRKILIFLIQYIKMNGKNKNFDNKKNKKVTFTIRIRKYLI